MTFDTPSRCSHPRHYGQRRNPGSRATEVRMWPRRCLKTLQNCWVVSTLPKKTMSQSWSIWINHGQYESVIVNYDSCSQLYVNVKRHITRTVRIAAKSRRMKLQEWGLASLLHHVFFGKCFNGMIRVDPHTQNLTFQATKSLESSRLSACYWYFPQC